MHPSVLESLTEQRIEELRASRSSYSGSRGRKLFGRNSPGAGTPGPVGRVQARFGTWMVDAGSKLVAGSGAVSSVHHTAAKI